MCGKARMINIDYNFAVMHEWNWEEANYMRNFLYKSYLLWTVRPLFAAWVSNRKSAVSFLCALTRDINNWAEPFVFPGLGCASFIYTQQTRMEQIRKPSKDIWESFIKQQESIKPPSSSVVEFETCLFKMYKLSTVPSWPAGCEGSAQQLLY